MKRRRRRWRKRSWMNRNVKGRESKKKIYKKNEMKEYDEGLANESKDTKEKYMWKVKSCRSRK